MYKIWILKKTRVKSHTVLTKVTQSQIMYERFISVGLIGQVTRLLICLFLKRGQVNTFSGGRFFLVKEQFYSFS